MKNFNPTILVVATLLTCALLIPIFLNWNAYVLIFIFLAFSTFSIGYLFARRQNGRDEYLANREKILSILAGSLGEILIIHRMEDHGNIFVSPGIRRILGYDPAFIRRKFTTFIVHPDDRKLIVPRLKMAPLQSGKKFKLPLRIRRFDGSYLPMLVTGQGIKSGNPNLITHILLTLNNLPDDQGNMRKTYTTEGISWKSKDRFERKF